MMIEDATNHWIARCLAEHEALSPAGKWARLAPLLRYEKRFPTVIEVPVEKEVSQWQKMIGERPIETPHAG